MSKRLTERDAYWYGEEFWISAKEPDDEKIDEIYMKLKEYEDLEEQDLLLKLPCKVGTDLYVVGTRCLADEEPNEEWCTAHDCDKCVYDNTYTVFKTVATKYILFMLVAETDENYILDKTVFLTKEEAEEALRKKVE